jgi:GT2 family glycosyltransferase
MQASTELAVVIVSYNSAGVLSTCLDALDHALARTSLRHPVELVVVDNASDSRPQIVESPWRRVTLLPLEENVGFARAVNTALEALPGADVVLLLNPDARLRPDALAALMKAWEQGATLAGPVLVDEADEPHGISERPFHSVAREATRQFFPFAVDRKPFAPKASQARCLVGACLLIDGEFLRSVGGLDTYIPMYLEDVELCWQAHAAGSSVRLVMDAHCGHALGGSSDGLNHRASIGLYLVLLAARVEFIRRRQGQLAAAEARAIIAVGAFARVVGAGLLRRSAVRRKHLASLSWAIRSGQPPAWPPSSGFASERST